MAKPGVCSLVWETNARIAMGGKTVLEPMEGAGAELLMDFLGTFVHTRPYSVHILHFSFIPVHTQYVTPALAHDPSVNYSTAPRPKRRRFKFEKNSRNGCDRFEKKTSWLPLFEHRLGANLDPE